MTDNTDDTEVRLVAHCRRCNGWLVASDSVRVGIGPVCATREATELHAAATDPAELTLFDIAA